MGNSVTEVSEDYKWAESIRSSWGRAISAFFDVGKKLNDAKEAIGHGRFMKMVEEKLPFGLPTAERLMAIARNRSCQNLPMCRICRRATQPCTS